MRKKELENRVKLGEVSLGQALTSIDFWKDYSCQFFDEFGRNFKLLVDYLGVEVKHDEARTYLAKKGKQK
jgi:hypothetical protein